MSELHLVKGVPYKFEITSRDVNHSFNIPDLTVLMDAIPGRINTMWVMPDASGEYLIQCREFCGFSHYQMRAKLFVEEPIVDAAADINPRDVQVGLHDSASVVASN